MKKFIYLIISIINICIMAIYLALTPKDTIPMHFDFWGQADRYGSKWELLYISGILVVFGLVYAIIKSIGKYVSEENKNKKLNNKIVAGIFGFLLIMFWIVSGICINSTVLIPNAFISIITVILGIFSIFICNLMPKLKQNRTTGIKISATLKSEYVWKKTHRLAGLTGVIAGCIAVICGIIAFIINSFGIQIFIISMCIIVTANVIIPHIYANILYKKERAGK